jgi:DNA-binding transcriptional LysR family regulator
MPRARLRVVSVDTLISSGGLEGGAVDAAIGPQEAATGLHTSALYEEDAVLVVRRGHPTVKKRLTREAFNSLRHVDIHLALGRGGAGHRVAEDAFARFGLVRDVAITVPTFTAAAMVTASTDLVAGLPRRVVDSLAKVADLVVVEAPMPAFHFTMQLVWHERTHLDPVAQLFRATVVEALGTAPRKRRSSRR